MDNHKDRSIISEAREKERLTKRSCQRIASPTSVSRLESAEDFGCVHSRAVVGGLNTTVS